MIEWPLLRYFRVVVPRGNFRTVQGDHHGVVGMQTVVCMVAEHRDEHQSFPKKMDRLRCYSTGTNYQLVHIVTYGHTL